MDNYPTTIENGILFHIDFDEDDNYAPRSRQIPPDTRQIGFRALAGYSQDALVITVPASVEFVDVMAFMIHCDSHVYIAFEGDPQLAPGVFGTWWEAQDSDWENYRNLPEVLCTRTERFTVLGQSGSGVQAYCAKYGIHFQELQTDRLDFNLLDFHPEQPPAPRRISDLSGLKPRGEDLTVYWQDVGMLINRQPMTDHLGHQLTFGDPVDTEQILTADPADRAIIQHLYGWNPQSLCRQEYKSLRIVEEATHVWWLEADSHRLIARFPRDQYQAAIRSLSHFLPIVWTGDRWQEDKWLACVEIK